MKNTLLVFDMDGVLVDPRRYRAALETTFDFFGNLMGWDSLYPGEDVIFWFESRGIISEWDMAPLYFAAVFEALLANNPQLQLPPDLISACNLIKSHRFSKPMIVIEESLNDLRTLQASGLTICDQALKIGDIGCPVFPLLRKSGFDTHILGRTREVTVNPIPRVFQEMMLGAEKFTSTFLMPTLSENQPSSTILDKQLISNNWRERLHTEWASGSILMVIYTARPSAFGVEDTEFDIHYSPEAEIVVQQLGWQGIPLIGAGQLRYAAKSLGCSIEELIKPSPCHALGSIGTALTGNPITAISTGWDLLHTKSNGFFHSFPETNIHVFEDSPTGIQGAVKAVELLKGIGSPVNLTIWGVGSNKHKVESLKKLGATIVPTINEALDTIFD